MINHDAIWEVFQKLVDNKKTAFENISSLLLELENLIPNLNIKLNNLEFLINEDVKDIASFLEQKAQQQNIPANTKALWINVESYTNSQTNEEVYASSINGCKAYDDENNFWNKQIVFQPQGLISLDSVAALNEQFISHEQYEYIDWILPLAATAFVCNEALDTKVNKSLFLKNVEFLEVCIGYADGDFIGLHPIFVPQS
jgi:hypothetical protein